jgi:hypothetical protein
MKQAKITNKHHDKINAGCKKRELVGQFRSHEIGQLVEWTWVTQIIILEKEFGIDNTII